MYKYLLLKKSSLQKHKNKATQRKTKMYEVFDHPLDGKLENTETLVSGGSVLESEPSIISGGAPKTNSDNNVYPLSEEVDKNLPSNPDYIRLMETLKKAESFCKENKLELDNLNNQSAQEKFINIFFKRCPNLENKSFKDIVDVMINVLHKYDMGFNNTFVRKSCSGKTESIMRICVKYLLGIVDKDIVERAVPLYLYDELARTQCRVRLWHPFSKGWKEKFMSAQELLFVLGIDILVKNPVKL